MIWKVYLPSNNLPLVSKPNSLAELLTFIKEKGLINNLHQFSLKYLDAENELINLNNQDDFDTAILSAHNDRVSTIQVYLIPITRRKSQSLNHKMIVDLINLPPHHKAPKKSITHLPDFSRIKDQKTIVKSECLLPTSQPKKEEQSQGIKMVKSLSFSPKTTTSTSTFSKNKRRPVNKLQGQKKNAQFELFDQIIKRKIEQRIAKEVENKLPLILNTLYQTYGMMKTPINNAIKASQSDKYDEDDGNNCNGKPPVCCSCNKCCNDVKTVCKFCFDRNFAMCQSVNKSNKNPKPTLRFERAGRRTKTLIDRTPEKGSIRDNYSYQRFRTFPLKHNSSFYNKNNNTNNNYKVKLLSERDEPLEVLVSESFKMKFTFRNCGDIKWPENVKLVCINGLHKNNEKLLPSLDPGRQITVELSTRAPQEPGRYLSQWKIMYGRETDKKSFGESFFEEILVKDGKLEKRNSVSESPKSGLLSKASSLGPEIETSIKTPSRRKGSLDNSGLLSKRTDGRNGNGQVGAPLPLALECRKDRAKCAEYLDEIFPGNYAEKRAFIEGLGDKCSIFDVVDRYLTRLGASMTQKTSSP